jgi:hypothetical protein
MPEFEIAVLSPPSGGFPLFAQFSFFEVFCGRHKLLPCVFNGLEEYWGYAEKRINVAF